MRKPSIGSLVFLFLCVLPVFLWFPVQPMSIRFMNFSAVLVTAGQIFGLVGAALFGLNLVLSARLGFLERSFRGLNKLYDSHRVFGEWALGLLLLHPLFLIPRYSDGSLGGALRFFLPSNNFPINLGIVALGLMLFLVALTLWFRPKYNLWKWTHKFLGAAFFLGALHVYLIPSDTSVNGPLRYYMLTIAGFGILAFLYRSVFGRLLVPRTAYTVDEVKKLNDTVVQIFMKPVRRPLVFAAGQFVFIHFKDKTVGGEAHPFSIASAPQEERLSLIVKNLGDYTAVLGALRVGSLASIEGPYGVFNYKNAKKKKMVWVAGGIGITPFLSMAAALQPEDAYEVDLYYCVKEESEEVAMNVLSEAQKRLGASFKIISFPSSSCGRITAEVIAQKTGDLKERDYFLCAPPAMIHALRDQLLAQGVALDAIHSEEFSF